MKKFSNKTAFFLAFLFGLSLTSSAQEKDTKQDVSKLADSFIKIAEQQEKEFQTLRNSGFSAMTQNMGSYQASMKEKNAQKTEILQTILKELQSGDAKNRHEAWKATDRILKSLDLDKLKEIDESHTKKGYYGYKLQDFAIILDIKYSEIKDTLTKAKSQEKDAEVAKYSADVMKAFQEKEVTEKK